ncbi:MAG: hypothetical protein IJ418_09250 [Clostridia bacterium]|nr:hypothetical protein [Clostridia bacterium]
MKITRRRILTAAAVARMCAEHGLYTDGDSEAYAAMLDKAGMQPNPTDEDLYQLAQDVAAHSKLPARMAGAPEAYVMQLLDGACVTFYDVDKSA